MEMYFIMFIVPTLMVKGIEFNNNYRLFTQLSSIESISVLACLVIKSPLRRR